MQGVIVHHVDTSNNSEVEQKLDPKRTKMVLLETPTNPLLKVIWLSTTTFPAIFFTK